MFDRLVTADDNQGQCKIERTFWWTSEFVSVEQFKVKKFPKARKVFKIFESDS